jgi:hypothetical protein
MKIMKALRLNASMLAIGGVLMLTGTAALAQTTLTADQTAAIQSSLAAAITAANGDPTAIETAISNAIQNAISTYGSGAAGSITAAVLTDAEADGVPQSEIGTGVAQAAAAESPTNSAAALSIASTMSNEGKSAEITAFETTATSLGYTNLASAAGASATPTGGTTGGGLTGGGLGNSFSGGFSGGGGSGGGGGCLNPSCTSL